MYNKIMRVEENGDFESSFDKSQEDTIIYWTRF